MLIKNFDQFKIYFYLYLLDLEGYDKKILEKQLKQYLMYKGVSVIKYRFNPETQNNYAVGNEKCHDLDSLISYYYQYGDI